MTRDDIICMAREAGWEKARAFDDCLACGVFDVERFAALVAAATLKNSVMTDEEYEQAMADEGQRRMLTFDTEVREMIKEAVEMEREAAIEDARTVGGEAGAEIEKLIRARGQE